jgi:isopenicillin N synthase-like dioxygenase
MTLMTVPIIDIAPYRTGAEGSKRAVAHKIDEACRDIGFSSSPDMGFPQT